MSTDIILSIEAYNKSIKKSTLIKFTNCKIHMNSQLVVEYILIRNGKILNSRDVYFNEKAYPNIIIDCQGFILSAGFIDMQINGAYGRDFSDPDQNIEESVTIVSKELIKHGVTSFCPTIITSAPEFYKKTLKMPFAKSKNYASNLGFHLEGPFLSKVKCGMHDKAYICNKLSEDSNKTLRDVYGDHVNNVKWVTLAAEIPNVCQMIRELISQGIIVSIGHSAASFQEGLNAIECGATMLTHLYCAMNPFHHRDPHLIGLLTHEKESGPIYFGIITDLIHTHETAIRIAQRANPNGLIVISDANVAMGLPDGNYNFGNREIEVKYGKSYLKGTTTLAGATTALDQCLRNYWSVTNISIGSALDSVTSRVSDALKLNEKGKLLPGYDADLILLDPNTLTVCATWINARLVHISDMSLIKITLTDMN